MKKAVIKNKYPNGGKIGLKEEIGLDALHLLAKLGKKSDLKKVPLLGSIISVTDKLINKEKLNSRDYLSLIPNPITQGLSLLGDIGDEITDGEFSKQENVYIKNKNAFNNMNQKQKEEFLKKRSLFKKGGKITAETIYSVSKQPKVILTPNDIYAKNGAKIDLSGTSGNRQVFSLDEFKNIVPKYQYQGYLNSGKEGM